MRVTPSRGGISLSLTPSTIQSFDVFFGGVRIWSFSTDRRHFKFFQPWPERLAERLTGYTDIAVKDSANPSRVFVESRVVFDDVDHYFRLQDSQGQLLMLNKWLRLAPMLDSGDGVDSRAFLAEIVNELISDLQRLEHQVFAVGGTALGAYRDGDFFRHDDDADLAVFFDTEKPIDVALSMMQINRELRKLGYRVRVHAHSHLQVYSKNTATSGLYVDVFAAFFKRGYINQPFHIRAPFTRNDLLPFRQTSVRGISLPIPRNVDKWFTANYDENWATPLPGFRLHTPLSASRRFKSWFGTFNIHRHYWDSYVKDREYEYDYRRIKPFPHEQRSTFASHTVLNVGCGPDPRLPEDIVLTSEKPLILGLDYSDEVRDVAARVANELPDINIKISEFNANNYHEILSLVRRLPNAPFDVYLGFLIEGQTDKRRQTSIWRLVKMALKSGGSVVADYVTKPTENVRGNDPRGWHLLDEEVRYEANVHGIRTLKLGEQEIDISNQRRPYSRVTFELVEKTTNQKYAIQEAQND